jgi:ribonuclease VapC
MVVDTSALVAIILREPDELVFAERIGRETTAVISAASYVELAMMARSRGSMGRELIDWTLQQVGIEIAPVTAAQARLAADAFAAFGRGRHPARLNFGDCFAYALAKERGEPLLFKGDDFARTGLVPAL